MYLLLNIYIQGDSARSLFFGMCWNGDIESNLNRFVHFEVKFDQ